MTDIDSNTIRTTAPNLMKSEQQETLLQQTLNNKTSHEDIGEELFKRELTKNLSSQHDVSPGTGTSIFLRCSLDVWHAVHYDTHSLNHALCDLLESATHLYEEQWLVQVSDFQ